jgi:hypothetical protein
MTQLVLPGRPGRRVIVRQRREELPPYTNCRLMVGVQGLIFGGLRVPDRARLVAVLRRATGVPEIGPDGPQGTTAADWLRAVGIVLPWITTITAQLESDDTILGGLARGEHHVAVAVPRYNGLPGRLARWSPRFGGGHMIGLLDARDIVDRPMVLWSDPLVTGSATAEWVLWSRVRPHLSQANGKVFATITPRGASMSTSIVLKRVCTTGTTARLPKGTDLYAYDPQMMSFAPAKPTTMATRALADVVVAVDQQPRGSGRPRGQFVRLADGPMSGRYARVGDVTLAEPTATDPVDVDAIRAAAFAEGRAAGVAETEDRYELLDIPVYTQVAGTVS